MSADCDGWLTVSRLRLHSNRIGLMSTHCCHPIFGDQCLHCSGSGPSSDAAEFTRSAAFQSLHYPACGRMNGMSERCRSHFWIRGTPSGGLWISVL